jgi:hypothetical protein
MSKRKFMSKQGNYLEVFMLNEDFDKIRSDFRFARIIRLARVCNAILFCFNSYLDYMDDDSPMGLRQRFNATFFLAGILYEGLEVIDNLKIHFGECKSFKNGFEKLINESNVIDFRKNELATSRDKFIFHYDKDVATKSLKILDFPEYLFVTASGTELGSSYFNLADEVAINYLIDNLKSKEDEKQFMRNYYGMLASISTEFIHSADKLFGEVLNEMGWKIRERKLDDSN